MLFIQIGHNISANFIFIQIRSYYVKISGNSFGLILLTICSLVSAMRSRKIVVFGVSYLDKAIAADPRSISKLVFLGVIQFLLLFFLAKAISSWPLRVTVD